MESMESNLVTLLALGGVTCVLLLCRVFRPRSHRLPGVSKPAQCAVHNTRAVASQHFKDGRSATEGGAAPLAVAARPRRASASRALRKRASRVSGISGFFSGKARAPPAALAERPKRASQGSSGDEHGGGDGAVLDVFEGDDIAIDPASLPEEERAQAAFDARRQALARPQLTPFRARVLAHIAELGGDDGDGGGDTRQKQQQRASAAAARRFCSDATLLRYLRARDGDPAAAFTMLEATLAWRAEHVNRHATAGAAASNGAMPSSSSYAPPCCRACARDPTAHCFFRLGVDVAGRHVIYSCAGRASNKVGRARSLARARMRLSRLH